MLSPPLLRILPGEIEVEVAVGDAGLDHRAFEPFIESRDGDPIGCATDGALPTAAVGGAVVARDDVGAFATGDAGVVIAGEDTGGPYFTGVVGAIVGVDAVAEALIDAVDVVVLNAPVGGAEEVDTVEDLEQVGVDALGGPQGLVVRIDLLANTAPFGQGTTIAQRVPEEDDWFALPVEKVGIVAVMGEHILQALHDFRARVEGWCVAFEVDGRGEIGPGGLL